MTKNQTPIIFLHGWSNKISSWDKNIEHFENLGFPVLAVKMPGFDLPNPLPSWGVPEYAKFAQAEIAEKFPNQQVILVGHSFGGRVSTLLASEHPELVKGLVLTSSAGLNLEPSILRKGLLLVSNLARWLEDKTFLSPMVSEIRKLVRSVIGTKGYKKADETMKQVFKNTVNLDLRDRLPLIKCPTLIVWGELDKTTPMKMAKAFHRGITNSKLVVIKDAEHSAHQTNSEEWNQIVGKFISTIEN